MTPTDKKLIIEPTRGGMMGPNLILKLGDKYVGHFYEDASEGIKAKEILESMCQVWNEEYSI